MSRKKTLGSLLDQYEGVAPKRDRSVPYTKPVIKTVDEKLLPTSVEMQHALEDKVEADTEKKREVSWSFADTYREWNKRTDEQQAVESAKNEKEGHPTCHGKYFYVTCHGASGDIGVCME